MYYDRRIEVALRNGNPAQGTVHNNSTFRTILYEKSTEKWELVLLSIFCVLFRCAPPPSSDVFFSAKVLLLFCGRNICSVLSTVSFNREIIAQICGIGLAVSAYINECFQPEEWGVHCEHVILRWNSGKGFRIYCLTSNFVRIEFTVTQSIFKNISVSPRKINLETKFHDRVIVNYVWNKCLFGLFSNAHIYNYLLWKFSPISRNISNGKMSA